MKRKRTAAAAHSVMVMVHPNAAAIDIGATMHMAAVGADRTSEPVRCFGTFTTDLHRLADWFAECGVETVVMESTGVVGIACVTNDRRHMSPATDTQVVLLELGIPNAVGDLIWQSAGDLPLPVTHEGMLRPGRIIGRPLVCDLCNVYQRSGPEEGAPPLFGLAIRVPIKDLPLQRTQPFEMALRLQARSVEKDSNVLTLKIMWNGKWSDDTEQMANHLAIDKE
jgi:hypothetical protein